MNIFSLGMDTLAEKIQRHGIYATVHNYSEWQTLAQHAAAARAASRALSPRPLTEPQRKVSFWYPRPVARSGYRHC
jgi:hypothetical protein